MPKVHLTVDQIKQAIAETSTMMQAAIKLGITFGSFKRHSKAHGLYVPNRGAKGTRKKSPTYCRGQGKNGNTALVA